MSKGNLFALLIIYTSIAWSQPSSAELSNQFHSNLVAVKIISSTDQARTNGFALPVIEGMLATKPLRKPFENTRLSPSVLDGIFLIELTEGISPIEFCEQMKRFSTVEYAVLLPKEELFHSPSDPLAHPTTGTQGYLNVIKAYEAWDITQGSPDIVIGIVDTGMDLIHEDLVGNYFRNPLETENGLDDDNNGYIDDILGYDFADNDNNPHAETTVNSTLNHGTHVGGLAGAATNNNLGIASVGYNCKISPLKGFTTIGTVSTGTWEGLLYAAENGYDIANLSWGNTAGYNQFFQDIIDYCVLEKDIVVIAAAGNTNADLDYYPASYEHVLSVGASTNSDAKWSSATYSHYIDLMAPGQNVLSTQKNNTYNTDSGSSHATPIVSGAAGLVKTVFPQYNARQIMEQLRVTSDNIYPLNTNAAHQFKLGKGRLNVFRAVSEPNSRSLRVHKFNYDNGFGQHAFFGDTLTIGFELTNYLANVNSPSLSLVSSTPVVTILNSSLQPGALTTMESKSNNEIKILLSESTPPNTEIDLRFTMSEGSYNDFQNVSFKTNPNDFNFGKTNLLSLKIDGSGNFAFTNPTYTSGSAMLYKGIPVMNYAGLMIGNSASSMQDNVTTNYAIPRSRDDDFKGEKYLKLKGHEKVPFYGYSEFSSKNGQYWIEQSIVPSIDDAYLIMQYRVVNVSGSNINNLHIGLFTDFFLANQTDNRARWDAPTNSLIFYDDAEKIFSALTLMDDQVHYAALDMQAVNGNVRDVGNTFTDADKFAILSGTHIPTAGVAGVGNDVAGLVSKSFPSLNANGDVKLAFAISMANSYQELAMNIASAKSVWENFKLNPPTEEVFYSCRGSDVNVNPKAGINYAFYRDASGQQLIGASNETTVTNVSGDTVIFARNLDGAFPSDLRKLKIKMIDQVANFEVSSDTLYLDHPTANTLLFTDKSFLPVNWQWDFGNGAFASTRHPQINFSIPGNYQITLTIESEIGCMDQITKEIVVANRPAPPNLSDFSICREETVQLTHATGEYVVFDGNGVQIQKGSSVTVGPFSKDSVVRIAHRINGFESKWQSVSVSVNPLLAAFSSYPDTTKASNQFIFIPDFKTALQYQWKIGDQLLSNETNYSHPISNGQIDLELTVSDNQCSDSISKTINFETSQPPTISDILICAGHDVFITPTNGTYFGFYSDQGLTQLIKKGTQLKLSAVLTERTVYVVGLDNGLPSNSVSLNISFIDFETTISADPPLLNLQHGSTVRLSPTNDQVVSTKWYVNGILEETALRPILLFTEPGTYQLRLTGYNEEGCSFTSELSYLVIPSVLGVESTRITSVFPNPSDHSFTISDESLVGATLSIFDLTGKEIYRRININESTIQIETIRFPTGTVIVKLVNGELVKESMVVIQH